MEDNSEPPEKNIWLFNITADPYEHKDVAHINPKVVMQMLDLLAQYNQTAVPCRYPKMDEKANPKYLGGYWGPWLWLVHLYYIPLHIDYIKTV